MSAIIKICLFARTRPTRKNKPDPSIFFVLPVCRKFSGSLRQICFQNYISYRCLNSKLITLWNGKHILLTNLGPSRGIQFTYIERRSKFIASIQCTFRQNLEHIFSNNNMRPQVLVDRTPYGTPCRGTAHQFIFVYFLISDIFRLKNIWEYWQTGFLTRPGRLMYI